MAYELRYAPTAARELGALLTYLAKQSPQGAARVGASIQKAERALVRYPYIGTLTTARLPPVRRLVVRPFPYILFYELEGDEIRIIGVRHAARDPSTMPDAP